MTGPITSTCAYGFGQMIRGTTIEAALERTANALKSEGFGVLTQIDVKDTLKRKLGVDVQPYLILGACNPVLAHKALTIDPQIGLLLPCNVVLQQLPDGVLVSIADPHAMFKLVDNPALQPVVDEAGERLKRVAGSL